MAQNPKFEGPDGVLRENYIFSTTVPSRFFTGTIDPDTVDMQVSVGGAGFSSDPDLVFFEGSSFTIPNPSAYPDGLQFFQGDNVVQVKSVFSTGRASQTSKITARLVTDKDIGTLVQAPSGVYVERFDRTVKVTVDALGDTGVVGYHFYGSIYPGGGPTGYSRLNASLVISGTLFEVEDTLGELAVDGVVATSNSGAPAADPLYFVYTATQQDSSESVIRTDFSEAIEIPETTTRVRTSISVKGIRQVERFSFEHDRQSTVTSAKNPAIPNALFTTILTEDPVYYVVTAVYMLNGIEYESVFSPEVSGAPLVITPTVGGLPNVNRQQIVRQTVSSIYRSQPQIDVKPGSVIRDIFIDPFSTEAERVRFVIDFLHRASSFATLLPIDDPGFTGQSIPVSQSSYKQALKQALFLENDRAVQTILDNAFDKLASNLGAKRRPGKRARGEVTVFTKTRPTTAISYGIGSAVVIGGNRYRLTSAVTITSSGAGAFYNPATGRYSARAFVQAENTGEASNIAAGQTGYLDGGPRGVSVTNEAEIFGGKSQETNFELANRALGKLSSVDTGTLQGYVRTVIDVPGISQVNVVESGHPLMMRDRTPEGRHIGGKVDIWMRGESVSTVTDNFAFSFEVAKEVQFEPFGDPQDLTFRAIDRRLSVDNPLIEMLSYPAYGIKMANETKGYDFDLTDVEVLTYNTIQLSAEYNDPTNIALADVISGSYRYRTSNTHTFTRQPVRAISSFEGEVSGVVSPTEYALHHDSDPLNMGKSVEAGDFLRVNQTSGATIPAGALLSVTDESHVILEGVEYLNRLGANPLSVQIWDKNKTLTYTSPFESSTENDYTFVQGSETSPLGIELTSGSRIKQGDTVQIAYKYDENFVVQYQANALVGIAQNAVDPTRHITADVLLKEAVRVPVDITATVVLKSSQNRNVAPNQVEADLRTALARFFNVLSLGEPVRQADLIQVMDAVSNVSYVVVPLTKMVKADGAQIVREEILAGEDADVEMISAWSTDTVKTYLLKNPLLWATTNGGGPSNEFRGVFANEVRLKHYNSRPNVNGYPLRNASGGAFIIGNQGLIIPGYSDDATLQERYTFSQDEVVREKEILAKRTELTQNRVLVTRTPDETVTDTAFTVTYVVSGATGVQNIEAGTAEYLVLGNVELSFDEDTDFKARVAGRKS